MHHPEAQRLAGLEPRRRDDAEPLAHYQRIAQHIKMKALHMAQVEFYDLMRKITQTIQKPLAEVSGGAPGMKPSRGM